MNANAFLWDTAKKGLALPILGFPAATKLGIKIGDLVRSAELTSEVISYVSQNTDIAAAMSLMDLSLEAEAFGAQIAFSEGEVPAVTKPVIDSPDDADKIRVASLSDGRIPMAIGAVRISAERIKDKPIIAGMIGPYSLAGRLLDVTEIIYYCYDEPDAVKTVLDKTSDFLIDYARALRDAGAAGVLIAEPLAGILNPTMAEEFSFPYVKKIIDAVKREDFAVIYHNCGNSVGMMLDGIFSQGASAYHFGNASDMKAILEKAPKDIICMGNIDPVACFTDGNEENMEFSVSSLLDACGKYPNFILSSGCDIPPHAKWENVEAFFRTAKKCRS